MVRINKFLASCNLGSRRKVEELILKKKVTINNILCTALSTQIDPEKDLVLVDGQNVEYSKQKIFIMLNKPKGYVVTKNDEFNRKTVFDLLPEFASALHPIGRLDHDSEGLLLLTNDGDITNKIIHPSSKTEKTYKAIVKGKIDMNKINLLRNGIKIEDYTTQPAKVFLQSSADDKSVLKITITEGKNRQIRKMLDSVGHEVINLKRLQIGHIKLERLSIGNWRFLKDNEILYLLRKFKSHETKKINKEQ